MFNFKSKEQYFSCVVCLKVYQKDILDSKVIQDVSI